MSPQALRRNALMALILMVVLGPLVVGGWYVVNKHIWARERMAQIEPRYARLLGLETQRGELQSALQRAASLRAQYIYPMSQDEAQSGNLAQQKVRDIFTIAGLQILSSQVLPAKEEKGFDRIPVLVRAEGEILALHSALAVLGNQQPVILLNELDVQVQGGLANLNLKFAPRLAVQFNLSVLRERP